MEKYEKPYIEMIELEEDVITSSTCHVQSPEICASDQCASDQ